MRDVVSVEIPEDLLAKLEALPELRYGAPPFDWTKEKDAALLRYWPTRRNREVARVLGCCIDTARNRYRKLTEGGES